MGEYRWELTMAGPPGHPPQQWVQVYHPSPAEVGAWERSRELAKEDEARRSAELAATEDDRQVARVVGSGNYYFSPSSLAHAWQTLTRQTDLAATHDLVEMAAAHRQTFTGRHVSKLRAKPKSRRRAWYLGSVGVWVTEDGTTYSASGGGGGSTLSGTYALEVGARPVLDERKDRRTARGMRYVVVVNGSHLIPARGVRGPELAAACAQIAQVRRGHTQPAGWTTSAVRPPR